MSVQCMSWVLNEPTTTGTDRLVLLSIANHANETGYAYPSVRTMAREANASERAVQRSLASLQESGLLEVRRNGAPDERIPKDRRPNLYKILRRGDAGGTPVADGVTEVAPRGVTPVTERGDAGGTQTVIEPSVKKMAATPSAHGRRDWLFEVVCEVCRLDADRLTRDERGRTNAAVKQLREVEATPEEVREKARRWRSMFPDSHLTPQSLTKSWTSIEVRPLRSARCSDCGQPLGKQHTPDACALNMRITGRAG